MLHVILYAIVPIVVVMLAGFISGKKGIFNGDDAKKFNKVVLDYALPAALFVSIVSASRSMLVDDLKLTLISLVVILACFMMVYFVYRYCFKGNTGADAAISALISGSPTIGFLGFAVLEPIFGTGAAVALVVAIVGIVVNAVGIPVGLALLNASVSASTGRKTSPWKPVVNALKQPVAWAPILAVVWVMAGIPWPKWLDPSFNLIKGANASLAVFSAGITLSAVKIVINWQAVIGSVIKLIVMPGLALVAGLLFGMKPENLQMLVIACALPPAFSGIIIADEYDTYVSTGTSSLTLSIILFIGFLPLWLWITQLATNTVITL
jgi:predicted permease